MRATVKWFDNRRGWGFLMLEDGRDAFVHHSALEGRGYVALHAGQPVECKLDESNPERLQAHHVVLATD